ncbi:MAG: Gfo/Idh/MocA family oxidoreductase [Chloroflexia bacterium]|nr:Gfo/Idh/MocA family oxidoreductase [Chloroflexia bacterium]
MLAAAPVAPRPPGRTEPDTQSPGTKGRQPLVTDTPNTTRWGILSTGRIAGLFATGLASAPGAELVAVGSRTQESADRFADQFDIPRRHASYADLAADPEVDVIYVATPHPGHKDAALTCIAAGKNVLCEKPFALNLGEATEMVEAARAKGVFLMEAMWTRFRPAMVKVREVLASGAIGDITLVTANIGWKAGFDPASRLYDPELGGGALLDGGVYPLSFVSMVLGAPSEVTGLAVLGKTGVDEQEAISLLHPSGAVACVGVTIRANPISLATIVGTSGRIQIDHDFHKPISFTVFVDGKEPERHEYPLAEGNGYQFEAMHVMECLQQGVTESPIMPLDESLTIMNTMDTLRAQWGVRYPQETG